MKIIRLLILLIALIRILIFSIESNRYSDKRKQLELNIIAVAIVVSFIFNYIPKGYIGVNTNNEEILPPGLHINIPKIILLKDDEKSFDLSHQGNSSLENININIKYYINDNQEIEPIIERLFNMTLQTYLSQTNVPQNETDSALIKKFLQKECNEILGKKTVFIQKVNIY